ncbi:hotdog fold domain-containing protein [Aerolutibacter ruishenii]|uniref:Acyl-coenzyme A thioesterase PaaI-like protein n=1 Tax=Aerolutibacter ruishenii TaxID=686800 RepID=A0A562LP59_9GAMM|nr:hotdog fold domain-containing protein [Lysobacter ruishenii]TWI09414.1 acyl-coenzyme A thioesterase PaaI-like protein [Lysobacter ruishenii]
MPPVLALFRRITRWPGGHWLFSRAVCLKAPYFATIAPRFVTLEPGRCEVRMRDRRRVHNHLGTVHAIALCNLAELSAGVMTDASLPTGMRWIPKGMSVEYLKKAKGTMHAVAIPDRPLVDADTGYDAPVTVAIRDEAGDTVFRARIAMWVSPRPPRTEARAG